MLPLRGDIFRDFYLKYNLLPTANPFYAGAKLWKINLLIYSCFGRLMYLILPMLVGYADNFFFFCNSISPLGLIIFFTDLEIKNLEVAF